MANEQVTVVARVKAREGMEDRLREETEALIEPTRSEEGCLNYDLHQGTDDPSVLLFYENWRSQEDLDEHLEQPYLKEWMEKIGDLAEGGDVEITLLQMISPLRPGRRAGKERGGDRRG
jgi:quinol monooxygenase YgiN